MENSPVIFCIPAYLWTELLSPTWLWVYTSNGSGYLLPQTGYIAFADKWFVSVCNFIHSSSKLITVIDSIWIKCAPKVSREGEEVGRTQCFCWGCNLSLLREQKNISEFKGAAMFYSKYVWEMRDASVKKNMSWWVYWGKKLCVWSVTPSSKIKITLRYFLRMKDIRHCRIPQ